MNPNSPDLNFVVKWHVKAANELPAVKNHASVIYKDLIYTFGGYNGESNLNDLFAYSINDDESSIQKTYGEVPKKRNGHTATLYSNLIAD